MVLMPGFLNCTDNDTQAVRIVLVLQALQRHPLWCRISLATGMVKWRRHLERPWSSLLMHLQVLPPCLIVWSSLIFMLLSAVLLCSAQAYVE